MKEWATHTENWVNAAVKQGAQLLVFPEYGAMELTNLLPESEKTDLQAQIAGLSRLKDDFLEVFSALSRKNHITIALPSYPAPEGGVVVNRTYVCGSNGLAGYQDKFFMTRFEREDWIIEPGQLALKAFETDWGIFGIQICYDVEFPLGAKLLCENGASLLLAPSCTETVRGATRVHIGARARALENQCYVAVSQVVGDALWSPAVDINYGYAAVYATPDAGFPELGIISEKAAQEPGWLIQELDFQAIENVRKNGQVLNFRDHQSSGYTLNGQYPEVIRIRV